MWLSDLQACRTLAGHVAASRGEPRFGVLGEPGVNAALQVADGQLRLRRAVDAPRFELSARFPRLSLLVSIDASAPPAALSSNGQRLLTLLPTRGHLRHNTTRWELADGLAAIASVDAPAGGVTARRVIGLGRLGERPLSFVVTAPSEDAGALWTGEVRRPLSGPATIAAAGHGATTPWRVEGGGGALSLTLRPRAGLAAVDQIAAVVSGRVIDDGGGHLDVTDLPALLLPTIAGPVARLPG